MKMRKFAAIILSLGFSLITSASAHDVDPVTPKDICKQKKLRIGVAIDVPDIIPEKKDDALPAPVPEASYPPYLIPLYREQLPENKERVFAAGFDLEIIKIIQKEFCDEPLPYPTVYYAPYDELFERLRLRQFDFIIAAIAASTPSEKRRGIAYSLPYNERGGDAIAVPTEVRDAKKIQPGLITETTGTIEKALYQRSVYFEGDTLGKEKLSYVTGLDAKTLKQFSVIASPQGSLHDVIQGAINSNGAILLDLPTLRFFMTYKPQNTKDDFYKDLRDGKKWSLLKVKPDAQGDERYLIMKSGDVIATRLEDEKLLARINGVINHARLTNELAGKERAWFGTDGTGINYKDILSRDNALALIDSGKNLPNPYKKKISFSFSVGTPILRSEGGQKIEGTLELGDEWPKSHEFTDWWSKFIHSPICLGIGQCANEMGLSLDVTEEPEVKDDVSITLKRSVDIGPYWRYHVEGGFFDKTWWGYKIGAVYTKKVNADKTSNVFTEEGRWKAAFIPQAGIDIPFSDKVKLSLSVEVDDWFQSQDKPQPSLKGKIGITVETN